MQLVSVPFICREAEQSSDNGASFHMPLCFPSLPPVWPGYAGPAIPALLPGCNIAEIPDQSSRLAAVADVS